MADGRIAMNPLAPFADNRAGGKNYETDRTFRLKYPSRSNISQSSMSYHDSGLFWAPKSDKTQYE